MKPSDVFKFNSYTEFLKQYYFYKNKKNSNFNYTVWSKKLNFANVATLTRLLNGERLPGPQVIDSFCQYFQFNPEEKDYFTTLIRIEKESDLSVRFLYLKRLEDIQKNVRRPLIEMNARNLILWGNAEPKAFNQYLEKFGFESLLSYGSSTTSVCVNGAYVYDSPLGLYAQFCFACYAKRKGHALAESEMFFGEVYTNQSKVADQFNSWGSTYEMRELRHGLEPEMNELSFSVVESNSEIIRFSMAKNLLPVSEAEQPNHIYGYNSKFGVKKGFKMIFNSTAQFREFNATVDHCSWNANSNIGKILTEIKFQPTFWTYQPDFNSVIYPAEDR